MFIKSTHITLGSKRSLQSYAGVNLATYQKIHQEFATMEQERLIELSKRPDRLRKAGGGKKSALPTIADKVLFILHYYKTYPTMDVMAVHYEISPACVCNHVHALSAILHQVLVKLAVMPMRELPNPQEFKAYLEANKIHQLIIDATERNIERPKDKKANKAQYSGKKKDIQLKIRS